MLFANVRGLRTNLPDLCVRARQCDVVLCSETKVSDRHVAELRIPGFGSPAQIRCGDLPEARGLIAYVRDGFAAHRQRTYECGCCEMLVIRVCGGRQNFYVFAVYRNPNLDDHIYDCLIDSMARIESVDGRAAFVFVGDLNAHHQEWQFPVTNPHGRMAMEFTISSGCTQLVHEPTHQDGGVLDLVITDVPDIVNVEVRAPIGTSDHSSLSVTVLTSQSVPDVSYQKDVFLKDAARWPEMREDVLRLEWGPIIRSPDPVLTMNASLRCVLQRHLPVRTIRIRPRDRPWFDDTCRRVQQRK